MRLKAKAKRDEHDVMKHITHLVSDLPGEPCLKRLNRKQFELENKNEAKRYVPATTNQLLCTLRYLY